MIRKILKRRVGSIASIILVVVLVLAIFGPLLAPYDPFAGSEDVLHGPSFLHPLGTDYLGRDTLSRMLHGAPLSVLSAGIVGLIALVVGVIPGILSVYLGRTFEWLSLRLVDTLVALPFLIFAVAVTAFLGNGVIPAMCVVGFLTSPIFYRVARAATLTVSRTPYVEAAVLAGATLGWTVRKHVWSKVLPSVAIALANTLGIGLISVAALSFLGIGVQPPEPTWGGMLAADLGYLTQRPFAPVFPAVAIVITVWSLNIIADLIRDVDAEPSAGRNTQPLSPRRRKTVAVADA
ncbi:MAG: ABC transporter permease [Micrococcaceae bacterium]